jgi:hypothetical protein
MTRRLATGSIVWAEIADANGVRKLRPAVILRSADQATFAGPFDVVAVTSRLADPLPADHVLLPWHPRGHPRTGLNRRSAAVCAWLAQVAESDIQDVGGIVPGPVLSVILAKVAAALSPPDSPPDSPSSSPDATATDPPNAPDSTKNEKQGNSESQLP